MPATKTDWEITSWTGPFDPEGVTRRGNQHAHEPRQCTVWDLTKAKEGATPDAEIIEDINAYLEPFAAPVIADTRSLCFHCGEGLTGTLVDSLLGRAGFEWGLAHGEGHCSACGWPARAYHVIKDRHGEQLMSLRPLILSYRPATAEERAKEAAETEDLTA